MTTTSAAVLFPGQGAYYGRALADLREAFPEVAAILSEVAEAAGPLLGESAAARLLATGTHDIDEWLRDAPEALQLAIYTVSVATYEVLRRRGLRPGVLVGHSLGEISALVAARAFSVAEGAQIVCHRTLALREAGLGDAYMAAVGTNAEQAQRLLDLVGDRQTAVAVENHPGQTVLSGNAQTLDAVARVAAALRVDFVRLKSPYPFHSPLLGAAAEKFAERTRDIRQRRIETPVYSPIAGRAYRDDDELTELLAGHFTCRVRFADAVREVGGRGISVLVEAGALDTLSRIAGKLLGGSVTTVPTLLPGAGGGADRLHRALDRLVAAGLVQAAGSGQDRTLLADIPSAGFEQFWRRRGGEVRAFARQLYLADRTPPGEPATDRADTPTDTSPAENAQAGARGPDREALVRELVDVYAEVLEYPSEVFAEDTDLEGELGVDSVKQTELLVRVGERYGLPPRPSDVRPGSFNTLGKIADLILEPA